MNEDNKSYRLTPKGFFYYALGEATGERLEKELKEYLKKTGDNSIVFDDGELSFEQVAQDWDR
jgi:hypothetical protein